VLVLLLIAPYFIRWVRQHWLPFTIVWLLGLELFFVGLLPLILNALGGSSAPATVYALGSAFPLSFYAVLTTNIWLGWPFMMAIATGALQGIPRELYEAAEVDGATAWKSFWNITVPMIRPAMIPAIMIGMMWTFNQFNVIYFVSGGGPLHQTEILVTQAYRLVNETSINLPGLGSVKPYGVAASFAYIVFAVLATLTLITNRITRATESYAE
jgi:arabinogalactan oligomer/maltooligosaccharide transport system permease protein